MHFKASNFTLVSGVGKGTTELNAFDNALQMAGVGDYNLSRVSSILPPKAIETKEIKVAPGSLLPIAYGSFVSGKKGKEIVAAVGVGIPENPNDIGVIMECSDFSSKEQAELKIQEMIEEAMKNRNIEIAEIKCVVSRCVVDSRFQCVFAGIALW